MVRFDLGPLVLGQTRIAKVKSETNLQEIMGWESSDVFRFEFGPLPQGRMRTAKLKSPYNLLIIGPRSLQCETNLWKS